MNTNTAASSPTPSAAQRATFSAVTVVAWAVVLLASLLPDILMRETTGHAGAWLLWARLGVLASLIAGTLVIRAIRPLRGLFVVLGMFYVVSWAASIVIETVLWKQWFANVPFQVDMLGTQLLKLFAALVMIGTLFVIRRQRNAFFLTVGDLRAPAEPVRWLFDTPVSWARLAPIAAVCIGLGTLVFLLLAGVPAPNRIAAALPLLPLVLVFAALNAFSEQVTYRMAILATTHEVVGKRQALLLTAAYFGVAHFYGVPYGVIGVVMAGVLGWFLAKAMLETRGFFWPWFIHFCQDALIFTFLAIGAVVPGG